MRSTRGRRVAVYLALTALATTAAGCSSGASADVVASPAAPGNLHIAPAGTGPVVAAVDNAVVVERRATVTSVDVLEGAEVKAGQQLLSVYTIGDTAAVATAENHLRADEKQLASVRARDGIGARTTITLNEQVARDRQALTNLKSSPTTVRAPVAGRISGLTIHVGEQLTRTDVTMHVIDDRRIRVVVPVAAEYRRLITVGRAAQLSLPGGSGRSYGATVVGIGPSVQSSPTEVETIPITVELQNTSTSIALGSVAYVRFPIEYQAPVSVNWLAVLGSQQQPFVFVVIGGRVQQRAVVTGISDEHSTEIVTGLTSGDVVVISGGKRLTSGDPVHASISGPS